MDKLTKQINFWLSEALFEDLKSVADKELIDRSTAIRKAIDLYVRRHKSDIYQVDLPVSIIREVKGYVKDDRA